MTMMPLKMVGSTKFGRFPKMSSEQTFNMIEADGWLFPFAGYRRVLELNPNGEGRGIYASEKLKKMFAVIDDRVYMFDKNLSPNVIGLLQTFKGDVFITDNNTGYVAFSDSQKLYIYNTTTTPPTFYQETNFVDIPGYITYQDTRFITPNLNTSFWQISTVGYALSPPEITTPWPGSDSQFAAQYVGEVSTKPTNAVACVRFPGKGNLLLVFGTNVTEFYTDIGSQLFPYQRSQSHSIDYGCINAATIGALDNMVCWVGINEQSGPAIMFTTGGAAEKISTDGIDYLLSGLVEPSNCYGFMVRLSGHVCYVVTWPGKKDNVSFVYDFNNQAFYSLCDENRNAFIVKRIAFFDDKYFFVSIIDGNIYELSASLFSYDYGDGNIKEVPYIRIPPNIAFPNQSRFVVPEMGFTIQSGEFPYNTPDNDRIPRVDLNLSKDGAVNFGNIVSRQMRPQGKRQNILRWFGMGSANDMTPQFRFHGIGPFVAKDGYAEVQQ